MSAQIFAIGYTGAKHVYEIILIFFTTGTLKLICNFHTQ